eukprot:9083732-Lingulodinium_polyedra.AAC.1
MAFWQVFRTTLPPTPNFSGGVVGLSACSTASDCTRARARKPSRETRPTPRASARNTRAASPTRASLFS